MSSDQIIPKIALVGSPNSGKTTLFNWLTGLRVKTINYAGSTVDVHHGQLLHVWGESMSVLDTPGIYSFRPHGQDEEVTFQALRQSSSEVSACILVLDGTQLNRQLYLVRQLQEMKLPFVVAITMMDLVKGAGRRLDLGKLGELIDAPVMVIDGRLGGGVKDLVEVARSLAKSHTSRPAMGDLNWDDARIEREIAVAEAWTKQVVFKAYDKESLEHLRRWDQLLLHPVWGIAFFVIAMGAIFSSIFWLAAPLMDFVDVAFSWLGQIVQNQLGENLLTDFVGNGVIGGVGAVLVFVPQIFILFLGFTLLEDSGYLARAATIVDRPLQMMGLSGRAFVPILSGFACAVPAVMATRNMRSSRERWITVFIIPFMTCSARLPVYALLLSFLFHDRPWLAGIALTGLYIGGVVIGAVAAAILNRLLPRTSSGYFLMELPVYRWPKAGFTLRIALRRTISYVKKAGPTILMFVLLLWAGTHLPYRTDHSPEQQLSQSYVGRIGQVIEPVFEPMGLDWRAGLGILSAFVAREVFVSSLAVIFNIADDDEGGLQEGLLSKMRHATFAKSGEFVFTTASVVGLIVYFMIALQCLSTTGVVWREMGSWKFAVAQVVVMNLLGYIGAVFAVAMLS